MPESRLGVVPAEVDDAEVVGPGDPEPEEFSINKVDKDPRSGYSRSMDLDQAIRVVSSPENLSTFAEHGFRTADKRRVVASLTKTGLDPDTALAAARAAVESVGGFVTSSERDPELGGGRASWRYIYEVWMVPEGVADIRAA